MYTNTIRDTHTRIIVQIPGHTVDITVAREQPLAAAVTEIVTYLRTAMATTTDEVAIEWIKDRNAIWQLTDTVNRHLEAGKTLKDLDITDGKVLTLVKSDQRQAYAPLIDDVAESIAFSQKDMAPWTSASARALAAVAAPVVALVAVSTLVFGAWAGKLDSIGQAIACGVLAVVGAGLISAAGVGIRKVIDSSTRTLTAAVVLVGYLCVAGAGLLVLPGSVGGLSVAVSALVTMTTGVIGLTSIRQPSQLHYATATFGALVLAACLLAMVTENDPMVFAVLLGATALVFLAFVPRFSLVLAGIPMPFVPTMGETFVHENSDDITTVESGTSSAAITAIINQEGQVRSARECSIGLTWGALGAITISSVIAAANMHHHQSAVMVFYVVITIATLFRGKSFEDAVLSRSWLVAASLTYTVFVLTLAFTATDYTYALIGLGVLVLGTAAGCYISIKEKVVNSPIMLKLLEIIESMSFATTIVLIVVILDGYNKVRGR
ncbi:type VII secretion integral membrane protein EccD [Rhodococcus qingshengii]|uniref:type VII secretion integral membrane protein EccD n=1 Tax=Rhodococcus qingshengii TaxID=334542 RepID=UPI0021B12EE8|nr:type VII secretion integral membrane protein EccD [Rhodococcus qingshengii]MCT6735362.1 type VII secretion integral membrane protein EccD [Rhodococcus qingshengii]